jgi:hypothetical protein
MKNSTSREARAAARNVCSNSRLLIPSPFRSTARLAYQTNKGAGLSKPSSHRRVAAQELGDLSAGQPGEDSMPFPEDGPNAPAIASHPALKVPAGGLEQPAIAAEPGCDLPILRCVVPVNELVRELSWHRRSVGGPAEFGQSRNIVTDT